MSKELNKKIVGNLIAKKDCISCGEPVEKEKIPSYARELNYVHLGIKATYFYPTFCRTCRKRISNA